MRPPRDVAGDVIGIALWVVGPQLQVTNIPLGRSQRLPKVRHNNQFVHLCPREDGCLVASLCLLRLFRRRRRQRRRCPRTGCECCWGGRGGGSDCGGGGAERPKPQLHELVELLELPERDVEADGADGHQPRVHGALLHRVVGLPEVAPQRLDDEVGAGLGGVGGLCGGGGGTVDTQRRRRKSDGQQVHSALVLSVALVVQEGVYLLYGEYGDGVRGGLPIEHNAHRIHNKVHNQRAVG
mmetsp:Transcript_33343/g.78174  ORF Transcript_33343/g.78174 Transcript_33343/m.78174 type:complete len:239 (-) Transcript_33343:346-1062(-)